jgi:hypothetical protein
MKNLIVGFLSLIVSFVSFSQTYKFDVKNYDLYVTNGFFEKDVILKNTKSFESKICDRNYVVDLDKKVTFFYENGVLVEKLNISNVIKNGDEFEIAVDTYINGNITTFLIYLTLKNNKINDVCLLWYDPFNNRTFVRNVN